MKNEVKKFKEGHIIRYPPFRDDVCYLILKGGIVVVSVVLLALAETMIKKPERRR